MTKRNKALLHGSLTLIVLLVIAWLMAPSVVEDMQNRVDRSNEWPVSSEALALHDTLRIADLHADSLLWQRDFLARGSRGHVDVPRLIEGGVAVQVMATVTKSPRGLNYESNATDSADNITLLAYVQGWPSAARSSLLERALYQGERLTEYAAADPRLTVIDNADGLARFLDERALADGAQVATLLATEGAHPLEGNADNLERLWQAGFRMLGLQHFFDNALGGSLHGQSRAGLTPFGREAVQRAVDMGFIIDVAHSSPAVVDEVLAMLAESGTPVVVSHTGVKGTCDSPRNLEDEQMQRIAAAGGLIGIGFWDAVCDISPRGVARAIAYAVELVGVGNVALGSDYDGATEVTFDAAELAVLTQALLDEGLSAGQIRQVMGENQIRFLLNQLPGAS